MKGQLVLDNIIPTKIFSPIQETGQLKRFYKMSQIMDVIVIGCGASGIAAIRKLHDAGLKVLGLEASENVGGRICTTRFGDAALDIGAAWCHGEKDNIVFDLVKDLDLLGRPKPDHRWFVLSDGSLVPNETAETMENTLNAIIAQADKKTTQSISECVRKGAKTNELLQKDHALTDSFIKWFESNSHLGGQDEPENGKSLRGLEECWACEGEFMLNWKGRGYRTILDVLLNKYPNPSEEIPVEILTNKEVETIKWKASQGGDTGNPLVHVKCLDGSLYAAKSVIVTVSIGVLKERHNHLFNPQLPAEKINSINTLQLCVLDKIYIEFESPWWPKFPANFNLLWQPQDKDTFSSDEQWITEIYGFNTVEYQPNLLLAWIYGKGAEDMEKASLESVKEGISKLVQTVFGKEFSVTPVKNVVRSQWASNPLIRGAYSYRSVASEQNGGSAIIFSEPLYHGDDYPIVCFAGEATSHHRHGAVHGAIESGFREAGRIIHHLKNI